jgi:hypothetical protein
MIRNIPRDNKQKIIQNKWKAYNIIHLLYQNIEKLREKKVNKIIELKIK